MRGDDIGRGRMRGDNRRPERMDGLKRQGRTRRDTAGRKSRQDVEGCHRMKGDERTEATAEDVSGRGQMLKVSKQKRVAKDDW